MDLKWLLLRLLMLLALPQTTKPWQVRKWVVFKKGKMISLWIIVTGDGRPISGFGARPTGTMAGPVAPPPPPLPPPPPVAAASGSTPPNFTKGKLHEELGIRVATIDNYQVFGPYRMGATTLCPSLHLHRLYITSHLHPFAGRGV